jgi:hypothetical protein
MKAEPLLHERQVVAEDAFYSFTTPAQLLADFWNDVDPWRS